MRAAVERRRPPTSTSRRRPPTSTSRRRPPTSTSREVFHSEVFTARSSREPCTEEALPACHTVVCGHMHACYAWPPAYYAWPPACMRGHQHACVATKWIGARPTPSRLCVLGGCLAALANPARASTTNTTRASRHGHVGVNLYGVNRTCRLSTMQRRVDMTPQNLEHDMT